MIIAGPEVRLIPLSYIKSYLRRQKNDTAAICKAVTRPFQRFGPAARSPRCQCIGRKRREASRAVFETTDNSTDSLSLEDTIAHVAYALTCIEYNINRMNTLLTIYGVRLSTITS